ncbi:hypothetical protein DFH28DRAFT_1129395 [Melampsora americana]|nr:hypothetical protein DFH28DRAFT_1129395 [Melampsora americana]
MEVPRRKTSKGVESQDEPRPPNAGFSGCPRGRVFLQHQNGPRARKTRRGSPAGHLERLPDRNLDEGPRVDGGFPGVPGNPSRKELTSRLILQRETSSERRARKKEEKASRKLEGRSERRSLREEEDRRAAAGLSVDLNFSVHLHH